MKNQPKVSVVIPCYNVEKYICQCLDSVINQTLKDMEIICINDGSKDNTGKILDEYKIKDKRIKVIHKENEGVHVARNMGIDLAQGEYLSFLDSDDFFELDMLEKMYYQAIKENADICICGCSYYKNGENIEKFYPLTEKPFSDISSFSIKDSFYADSIFQTTAGWPWDKIYKTNFIRKNAIVFPNCPPSEDLVFVRTALFLASKITHINDICVHYRLHPTSISHSSSKKQENFYIAVIELVKILERNNLFECVRKSFIKWVVPFCMWHLSILKNKNWRKTAIQNVKRLNTRFQILSYPPEFFPDKKAYNKFIFVCSKNRWITHYSLKLSKTFFYKLIYKLSFGETRKKYKKKYKEKKNETT